MLAAWLASQRAALHVPRIARLTLVLGNEAADMDSVAAAVLFARHLACHDPRHAARTVLPVVAVPRRELLLRSDVMLALDRAGATGGVVCADELPADPAEWLQLAADVCVALVDHNRLSPRFQALSGHVSDIVDHHQDEGFRPSLVLDNTEGLCWIASAGSCTSMVCTLWQQAQSAEASPEESWLALAAIFLDTSRLHNDKTTALDESAVEWLRSSIKATLLPTEDKPFKTWYRQLSAARQQVAHLASMDLLRRDHKECAYTAANLPVKVGISGAGNISLDEWAHRSDMVPSWIAWRRERSLDALFIMTTVHQDEGGIARELALICPAQSSLWQAVTHGIEADASSLALSLRSREARDDVIVWQWHQGNSRLSRKQLEPLLRRLVQQQCN